MKLETIHDFKLYLRGEKDLWGYYQNGEYEPEETKLIKNLVKPSHVCLDIGANVGYFTVLMAKQCKLVYAFEPEPSNYDLMIKNVVANDLGRKVIPFNNAVSDKTGSSKLYLCDASHGMHRLYKSKHCNKSINVNTLDIDSQDIQPDFVKIDVEGHEHSVILGMLMTLEKHHPTIVMEFHPPSIEESGHHPRGIYDQLIVLGYSIRLVPDIDKPISYERLYELTNNESGGQNILCLRN